MATIDTEVVLAPGRVRVIELAWVAAGGVLDTLARYGLGRLAPVATGRFPWTTFGINISGSLALGLVVALAAGRFVHRRYLRPFLGSGFLGAYTTYSTFVVEADRAVSVGHAPVAVAYVAASLIGGPLAAALGLWAGGRRRGAM